MTHRYDDAGYRSQVSDWVPDAGRLMAQARLRPEAFLVIAAGLALLLRGSQRVAAERSAAYPRVASSLRASGYAAGSEAGDLADQISETASEYVSSTRRWAQDTGEQLSQRSADLAQRARTFPAELDDAVRDHPLVLAALGMVVGVAIGAALPTTPIQSRLRADAKGVIGAFARPAERPGSTAEGAKDIARDVVGAGSHTSAASSSGFAQRAPLSTGAPSSPSGAGAFSGGLHRSQTEPSKI